MSARYFNEVNPDGPLAGTKCPVSPGRLRELYEGGWREENGKRVWCEPMSADEIVEHFETVYGFFTTSTSIFQWMKRSGIPRRVLSNAHKIALSKERRLMPPMETRRMDHLNKGPIDPGWSKRMRERMIKKCHERRLEKKCSWCGESYFVSKCHENSKFCSRSCHSKSNCLHRRGRSCFTDIWCRTCLLPSLRRAGTVNEKVSFRCVKCGHVTVNPLLEEPAPRQVLERHRELRAQGITLREVPALESSR